MKEGRVRPVIAEERGREEEEGGGTFNPTSRSFLRNRKLPVEPPSLLWRSCLWPMTGASPSPWQPPVGDKHPVGCLLIKSVRRPNCSWSTARCRRSPRWPVNREDVRWQGLPFICLTQRVWLLLNKTQNPAGKSPFKYGFNWCVYVCFTQHLYAHVMLLADLWFKWFNMH